MSGQLPPEDALRRRVKVEIRKRIRGLRNTMPVSACAERSTKICAQLNSLPMMEKSRAVALFWPIEQRHEVDLRPLDASLREKGAKIAYPAIDPESGTMTFRFVDDPSVLEEQGYGFSEPPSSALAASPGDLDVIVVPAIALDPTGHRIGYGAGYYDRTLAQFAPPAMTIGVAYDYQLIVEVPVTEGDVPVDWIVTDTRVLLASPPSGRG